jgi:hypothetical protein
MRTLLTSQIRQLLPVASGEYREDIFLSPQDISSCGVGAGDYAIFRVSDITPEAPPREEPVRINVAGGPGAEPNSLILNSAFFEELGFNPGQEWELLQARDSLPVQEVTLEPSPPHCYSKEELKRLGRGAFDGRCFCAPVGGPERVPLLRMGRQKVFRVRESSPSSLDVAALTVFSIEPGTRIKLYTPRRPGGTDLVVLMDVSESMKLKDFEQQKGRVVTRSEAALEALEQILEWHFHSPAPGARFALVVFGRDARAIYPDGAGGTAEISPHQIEALRRTSPDWNRRVDVTGSDVIAAIDAAAKLFADVDDRGNEGRFFLISDGAFRLGRRKHGGGSINHSRTELEIITDFVSRFYEETGICIHTVTVGCEDWTRRFEQGRYNDDMTRPEGKRGHIPNPALLNRIAQLTNGKSVAAQNVADLREVLKARPEGTMITLLT